MSLGRLEPGVLAVIESVPNVCVCVGGGLLDLISSNVYGRASWNGGRACVSHYSRYDT